ncbi:MAG: DNA-3-methyladenine glycosylase [Anaerolineae bacterium]|nr:DNA-3-methyladenine glycosylase [Anaerolineae bacterium]
MRQHGSEVKWPGAPGESQEGRAPLPRSFYSREPVEVARELIGKRLVRALDDAVLVSRIVETEAYRGTGDAASHASGGRTARNAPMFGPPGHAYVYFIYGMHWMFNISAHPADVPGAVLIRALQPEVGIDTMRRLRNQSTGRLLTNGPAKLAQALAIDGTLNDLDLCAKGELIVVTGSLQEGERIANGPRVRVPGGADAEQRPWRFWIKDNPWVSS